MTQLFSIIRKEIVHNVLSLRFAITYGLLICLVLLSIVLMTNEYQVRTQQHTANLRDLNRSIDALENTEDPGEQYEKVRQTKFIGLRRPERLGLFARGLENSLPTRISLEGWFSHSDRKRLGTNIMFRIFQTPDLIYVVTIVASLLTLLFVFDSVCGEKQQGTLKQVLANSVPRDVVLLGKWIGGYLSVALPFTIALLAGLVFVQVTGALNVTGEDLNQCLAVYLLSLAYISAVFTLGLMISTLTHHPSTSLLVCLLVWIGWILVVPNLAPVIAKLTTWLPNEEVLLPKRRRSIER